MISVATGSVPEPKTGKSSRCRAEPNLIFGSIQPRFHSGPERFQDGSERFKPSQHRLHPLPLSLQLQGHSTLPVRCPPHFIVLPAAFSLAGRSFLMTNPHETI